MFPPSVFVYAGALFHAHPSARVRVCHGIHCTSVTVKTGDGQQLVIPGADGSTRIGLTATTNIKNRAPAVSTLDVALTTNGNSPCGSGFVSWTTDVHLDAAGKLRSGSS